MTEQVAISLTNGHTEPGCLKMAGELFVQLSSGRYDECAVLPLDESPAVWRSHHGTARKRADRAKRRRYHALRMMSPRANEIYAINTSVDRRQGRPMSASYRQMPSDSPLPSYPCPYHAVRRYGIEDEHGVLVAYCVVYRSGQLALVSQILGHADHLENEIMYLLGERVYQSEWVDGGWLVYNRWDSGTDGLRFFKERLGFAPMEVEWKP